MSSAVDTTFPADGVKVSKADFRAQMLVISNELTALIQKTGTGFAAFNDVVSHGEVDTKIAAANKDNFSRDIAFNRVSL